MKTEEENTHPLGCTCPDCCDDNDYLWIDGEIVHIDEEEEEND